VSLFNVEAALAAQMSPAPAVRPTGIFPGVPAGQSTTGRDASIEGCPSIGLNIGLDRGRCWTVDLNLQCVKVTFVPPFWSNY